MRRKWPKRLLVAGVAVAAVFCWQSFKAYGEAQGKSQENSKAVSGSQKPSGRILQDFQHRVANFVALHKRLESQLPTLKSTPVAKEITDHQQQLARKIAEARGDSRQGALFTPEIGSELRRLIEVTLSGKNGANIRASLAHAEPVNAEVGVNAAYPPGIPLQSTPATLLLNLPKLPPELEYRIVGNALVLRDINADLVIDFLPDAIPREPPG